MVQGVLMGEKKRGQRSTLQPGSMNTKPWTQQPGRDNYPLQAIDDEVEEKTRKEEWHAPSIYTDTDAHISKDI